MAITGNDGIQYSYDSTDLIDELKEDINEFGATAQCYAWYKIMAGQKIYAKYDFITDKDPINNIEDRAIEIMQADTLLAKLEEQDSVI